MKYAYSISLNDTLIEDILMPASPAENLAIDLLLSGAIYQVHNSQISCGTDEPRRVTCV
jgi:hypothetical protein